MKNKKNGYKFASVKKTSLKTAVKKSLPRARTGITGFDAFSHGGIPRGRTTLVSGTTGSGKTIFGSAFIYNGITEFNENGVFVTFEETPEEIIKNMEGFGWDLNFLIKKNSFIFVDISKKDNTEKIEAGAYNMDALVSRIKYAIKKINAKRVTIDSISTIFERFENKSAIRDGLHYLATELKKMKMTTVLTSERQEERGGAPSVGLVDFVSDNVIILHSFIDAGLRNRTAEILKFRGTSYDSTETQLVIDESGIRVFPNPKIALTRGSSNEKISTGIKGLDELTYGGVYKKSTTLVTGASGVGKTITAMQFALEGAKRGENIIYVALEESGDQLVRNADSFGWKIKKYITNGTFNILSDIPEGKPIEEHYKTIEDAVKKINPKRFVLDSLSGLERNYSKEKFRGFTIAINNFLKNEGITSLMTNTTSSLLEVSTITETHLSTATDNIFILKYVELDGKMKRVLSVLKARGSDHDKDLREFVITKKGTVIGKAFENIRGLLSSSATRITSPTSGMKKMYELREMLENKEISQAEFERKHQELQKQIGKVEEKG
jgi:circadian clock protein KaiC